jgi:hypothetical protein
MSEKPEALRLADALKDDLVGYDGLSIPRRCQDIADEAAAELRRLHTENAALRAENRTLTRQNGEWLEIVKMLRADAERYRWLRNEANFAKRVAPQVCMLDCLTGKAEALHGDGVDAAIDAAKERT